MAKVIETRTDEDGRQIGLERDKATGRILTPADGKPPSVNRIVETKTDEATGREYRIYSDGTELWADTGSLKSGSLEHRLTSQRARELLARRHELAQQRAIEGIDEAAIEAGKIPMKKGGGGGEGWKYVVKHVASTLLKSSNLRGQAEAANFLGKATGNLTPDEVTPENVAVEIARLFLPFLERMNSKPEDRDTIEGKVRDV